MKQKDLFKLRQYRLMAISDSAQKYFYLAAFDFIKFKSGVPVAPGKFSKELKIHLN